ncbi:MAG: SGNH/GDSL hydrolase family protein [Cyanobacteria bacterium J06632_22]
MSLRKPALFFLILVVTLLLVVILFKGVGPLKSLMAPPISNRIVFLGDSITAGGASRPTGYVNLIEADLKQQNPGRGIEIIGAGISGNKVPDLQDRLQSDVLAQQPTHVVIYIGINDVWHFFFDDEIGTEPAAYEQGLQALIAQIQATGAEVSLCTPSVIGEDPDSDAEANQLLVEYAEISRQVARSSDAHLCDLRAAFEQYLQRNNPNQAYEGILTHDGVHLNDDGNRFVADVLLDHLQPLLTPLAVE